MKKLEYTEFYNRIEYTETCWIWTGPKSGKYGLWGRRMYAHRESYERHIGPIKEGLWVLHKCDVPLCVNPDHLFLGTQVDNLVDMFIKGRNNPKNGNFYKTHCIHGHEFNEANTHTDKEGKRHCRECDRLRHMSKRGE